MPPVAAGLLAFGGALNAAGLAAGAAVGLSAGTSFAVMGVFGQLAGGVAISALSQALMSKPQVGGTAGTKLNIALGEQQPQSFIMGRYATAGDAVFAASHQGQTDSTSNGFFTLVVELGDWPAALKRIWVNGEYVTLADTPHERYGYPVLEYRLGSHDYLWVRFYGGDQTTADAGLIAAYPPPATYPWLPDMIGLGIPYAIVTARLNQDVHRGKPECRFELETKWYDPRRDSTAGGSGAQRFNKPSTWKVTHNPKVFAYNIMRGIHDPVTGEFKWGGQGISARDLPASSWFAAMNACDEEVNTSDGPEPRYRAGLEVRLSDEPASVLEELDKACNGQTVEVAGSWLTRAGPPGPPVYYFTDDDIVITSPDTFDPFPRLDATFNGIQAVYPDPENGYDVKDAPPRYYPAYEAEDGGRRQVADLTFPAVPYRRQVQRRMKELAEDNRRFRRHAIVLPPETRYLTPIDVAAWGSQRNGYIAKEFTIDLGEDLSNGNHAFSLREVDPSDYDWSLGDELPVVVGQSKRPPRVEQPGQFSVTADRVRGANGRERASIRLDWIPATNVDAVRYKIRLAEDKSHVPGNSQAASQEPGSSSLNLTLNGEAVTLNGETVTYRTFEIVGALTTQITEGILASTAYEVSAIFAPTEGRSWSGWMPVTTLDIRLEEADLGDMIRAKIDYAKARSDEAAEDSLAALAKANEASELLGTLSDEALARAGELLDGLEGLDVDTIYNLTGIARAGLKRGWSEDPTFQQWTGGTPDKWTSAGAYAAKIGGFYGSALGFAVPTGTGSFSLRASSSVSGQLTAADPKAEYVAASILFKAVSGSLAGSRLRVEWRAAGSTTFTRGHAFGNDNSLGRLAEDWGFAVDSTRMQSKEVLFKRPVPDAVEIMLRFEGKQSSPTNAVEMEIHYLDVRAVSEAEIKGELAGVYTDAQIETLSATITGPGGALATQRTQITAEYKAADTVINNALVSTTATAVATADFASSAYVIRSVAGGGSAGLRLVAWDDKTGAGGAVVFDAPNVIAPGTLSAGEISVSDLGFNMVQDSELQSRSYWGLGSLFTLNANSLASAATSLGEIRYTGGIGTGTAACDGKAFPVRAGQVLTASYDVNKVNAGSYSVQPGLVFQDKDGATVSLAMIGSAVSTSDNALFTRSATITVPSGARKCAWRWRVDRTVSDANVRFFNPLVQKRSKGSSLITPDGAFFDMLTAEDAWIGTANIIDANVTTLKVAGNAISTPAGIYTAGAISVDVPNSSAVETFQTYTVNKPRAGAIRVDAGIEARKSAGSGGGTITVSLWRESTLVRTLITTASTDYVQADASYIDVDVQANTDITYRLRVTTSNSGGVEALARSRFIGVSDYATLKR